MFANTLSSHEHTRMCVCVCVYAVAADISLRCFYKCNNCCISPHCNNYTDFCVYTMSCRPPSLDGETLLTVSCMPLASRGIPGAQRHHRADQVGHSVEQAAYGREPASKSRSIEASPRFESSKRGRVSDTKSVRRHCNHTFVDHILAKLP